MQKAPKVSVIIPSLDGYREGNLPELIEDIKKQTFKDWQIYIVKGIFPNGRARNEGVKGTTGEILIFIDDDVRLGNEKVMENLVKVISEEKIGLAGPSQLIPEDSNDFQKKAVRQLSRVYFPVVKEITETDMVTHMCLAVRREVFEKVGRENENLVRGTDPDLRYRIRKAGYKIVVVPETWAYHPLPENLISLLKMNFEKGKGSAAVFKKFPDLIYEAPDYKVKNFVPKRSFIYRILRFIYRLFYFLFTGKFIRLSADTAYALGYIWEIIRGIDTQK